VLDRIHDLKIEFETQVQGLGKMFKQSLKTELEEYVAHTDAEIKNVKRLQNYSQESIKELKSSNLAAFEKMFKEMEVIKRRLMTG